MVVQHVFFCQLIKGDAAKHALGLGQSDSAGLAAYELRGRTVGYKVGGERNDASSKREQI